MESKSQIINFVIFAESREAAASIANSLTGSAESQAVWVGTSNGRTVKAYVRCPGLLAEASPKGNTDVLIVKAPADSDEAYITNVKSYINTRTGIPFKYIVSSQDLSQLASSVEASYINESQLASEFGSFISKVTDLESSLKTTFDSFDLNKNGFITSDELVEASAKLGHKLEKEEAKLIVSSLSNNGNIDFQMFKSWWVMGRGDCTMFRRIIEAQNVYGGLIKQGSEAFNEFLTKNISDGKDNYEGRVNVGPKDDFDSGIGFSVDLAAGKHFDEIFNAYPDYIKSSPFSFCLEIKLKNESTGILIKETFEGLKDSLSMIPKFDSLMMMGVTVDVRHVGLSVFIDFTLGGMIGDTTNNNLNAFNCEKLNYSGAGYCSLISGVNFNDIQNDDFLTLISKLLKLRLTSHSEITALKTLVYGLCKIIGESSQSSNKVKRTIGALKVLTAIRGIEFNFKYDPEELKNSVLDILRDQIGDQADKMVDQYQSQFGGFRDMGLGMLDNYKMMLEMIPPEFMNIIKNIDFDRVGVVAVVPKFKLQYKSYIHLPGLTQFVDEKVLN
jgi:hypothetical protein